MAQTKVLFISQEMAPYIPETPANALARSLACSVAENGYEVRTFMPKYGAINERRNQLHEVIRLSGLNIPIDDNDHPLIIKVATLQPIRMQVYFIDSEDYFSPSAGDGLETVTCAADNDERMMFFVRGTIETVKKLRWEPAVIQCQGWLSALAPLYLKKLYKDDPSFRSGKVIYTLTADSFDGTLDVRLAQKLALEAFSTADQRELKKALGKEPVDYLKLQKLAMDYADAVMIAGDGIDPALVEYARKLKKPVMECADPAEFRTVTADLYNKLLKA